MKNADGNPAADRPAKGRRADFDAGRMRFLDAAEQVYLAHGYAGATVRAISQAAGTSLARISRHWTGKQHLFEDVISRYFDAIHREQLAAFDRIEQSGAAGPDLVGAIVEAFCAPAFTAFGAASQPAQTIYCRAMVDPAPEVRAIVEVLVSPVRDRLVALIRRALPDLDEPALFVVLSAISGAYIYPQLFGRGLADSMRLDISALDWKAGAGQIGALFRKGLG